VSGELVAAQILVVYAASDPVIHFRDSSDFHHKEALIEWASNKVTRWLGGQSWRTLFGWELLVATANCSQAVVSEDYDESLAVPASWGLTASVDHMLQCKVTKLERESHRTIDMDIAGTYCTVKAPLAR
jgi:hypothetical protein